MLKLVRLGLRVGRNVEHLGQRNDSLMGLGGTFDNQHPRRRVNDRLVEAAAAGIAQERLGKRVDPVRVDVLKLVRLGLGVGRHVKLLGQSCHAFVDPRSRVNNQHPGFGVNDRPVRPAVL